MAREIKNLKLEMCHNNKRTWSEVRIYGRFYKQDSFFFNYEEQKETGIV